MRGRRAGIVLAVLLLVWAAPQLYAESQYVWITSLAPLGEGAGRFTILEALGSPGQRVLLRLLAEGNSAHRSFAARSLARSESPSDEVIDALMRAAVEDSHLAVRYDAVAALARIGSARARHDEVSAFWDEMPEFAQNARTALIRAVRVDSHPERSR